MKKPTRILALTLALLLCLSLLPAAAFAADGELVDVWVGGVQMKVGYYLPGGNNPTASSLTKTRPAGGYAYLKGVTSYSSYDAANLVLHDYSYDGKGYTKGDITSAIYNTMGLEIFIEGNNSLSGAKYGIYGTADHGSIYISANSTADSLTVRADGDGIHTEKAFTMNNGTLGVSAGNNGIYGNYNMSFQNAKVTAAANTGIFSGANIIFYSGTVVAEGNPKIKSSHGLWAFNAVSMEGGDVTASGTRFGIECGNVEYSAGGEIYFTGGTLTAYNSYEEKPIGDYIGKNAIGVRQVFYSREGRSYENSKVIVGEDASSAVPAVGQPYKGKYVKIYPSGDDDVGKDHLIPKNLRWNGKNAQWDAVPGATKYFVNFYCEGKQWQTKVVTDTKCELPNCYAFDQDYQFTVTAYVDGSYHKTSALSPKITYDNKTVKPWVVVSSVAVNNTQEPVAGAKVSWAAPTLPTGANYEFNQYGGELDYAWVEHTTQIHDYDDLLKLSAWHRLDDRDAFTFQEGKLYTLVIGLNAKEGYEFAPIDKLTGSINGEAGKLSDYKLAGWGGDTLVIYRTYYHLASKLDPTLIPTNLYWSPHGNMLALWDAPENSEPPLSYTYRLYRDSVLVASGKTPDRGIGLYDVVSQNGSGSYTFTVQAHYRAGTGLISVESDHSPAQYYSDPCEGYTDINRKAWYHSAVDFVIEGGYMGSTKTDKLTFEPSTKVSRAMVAQVLYSIAGNNEKVTYQGKFSDVPSGEWFAPAVEWCAQNGLAAGSDGKFNPKGNVTRQELTVFMMNLANYLKEDTTGRADLSGFPDADKVPIWAKEEMQWAVSYGLISGQQVGDKTYLNPAAGATRAEFATILENFLTK